MMASAPALKIPTIRANRQRSRIIITSPARMRPDAEAFRA
jgi:hypothetical protein